MKAPINAVHPIITGFSMHLNNKNPTIAEIKVRTYLAGTGIPVGKRKMIATRAATVAPMILIKCSLRYLPIATATTNPTATHDTAKRTRIHTLPSFKPT